MDSNAESRDIRSGLRMAWFEVSEVGRAVPVGEVGLLLCSRASSRESVGGLICREKRVKQVVNTSGSNSGKFSLDCQRALGLSRRILLQWELNLRVL